LDKEADGNLKGIFHCFTGNDVQARKIMSYKTFKMGIGGVVTFENTRLTETLKETNLDYIVLETDAPFLTPHPYRGKRNESAYVRFVAEKLAEVFDTDLETVAEITTKNAKEIFDF
jgi:TatD DNase family protein